MMDYGLEFKEVDWSDYRNGNFVRYTTHDGLTSSMIHSIIQASDGSLWLATEIGGLVHFKNGKFTAYSTERGLSNDQILCLYQDSNQVLWMGTRGGGLNRFQNGQFAEITHKDGLFDDVVFQILEDDFGSFWMSSNRGIFRVKKKELNDFVSGKIQTINCISYGMADGMRSAECNGGYQPGAWKSKDGRLWFPSIRGAVVVDPKNIPVNLVPPPVVIERTIVDNEPLWSTGEMLSLVPGKEKFEFQYTALSLLVPEKVQFKYKLEGYDRNWVEAGNRRTAYYTNIPPGHYRFRVIASNNDGIWNESGAQFAFELKPFFYQTKWFYLICLSAVAALAFAAHRFRVRRVTAKYSAVIVERTRIARELHDTLAQNLSGVVFQLKAAEATAEIDPERSSQHFHQAMEQSEECLKEARTAVWRLRPEYLEAGGVASALNYIANNVPMQDNRDIRFRIEGNSRRLPLQVEEQIVRIGQEALINATRHSGGSQIMVALKFDPKRVELRISDDGVGFDSGTISVSRNRKFGIAGMKERAREIGANLRIESQPGEGTEIVLLYPK